ncbi:MAG: valine--tRNA ligase [Candidatus Eremiobacteraeota bacterium]|nr:valine--tRNA ligase [Candidatus Eremiobacteraeota bacterium]
MKEIPKKYKHKDLEAEWKEKWKENRVFSWDPNGSRDNTFVIDSPPPTVSGSLHIGHVFSYTHQDLLARYNRMKGKNICYPMGWDDNGLPTERRVQNLFRVKCNPSVPYDPEWKAERRKKGPVLEISRQNFIEACATVTHEDEAAFEDLWRTLGLSIDWDLQYATIDEHCRKISQTSFLEMADKGMAYSMEAPTMWDVDFQTAVAQAEVVDHMRPGKFHDIRFTIDGGGDFVISTTRPELLPACIAVVAHPDDERYQELFGKHAITPLFDAKVPILASDHADPEKGTGILMVCTFGDSADVEFWKRSGLPIKQVIGRAGTLLPITFGEGNFHSENVEKAQKNYDELAGLAVKEAKARVAELLAADQLPDGRCPLVAEPHSIEHPVKYYEKGDRPLEFVPTRQWFVRLLEHRDALKAQGSKIKWHPSFMETRYQHWVEGLNLDWCISRQRYFGVPFPVWYPLDAQGECKFDEPIFAKPEQLPVDPMSFVPDGYTEEQRGQPNGFAGDPDVMDTWATSSLTPQIISHWSLDEKRHEKLFPMDIRPQSHEIIRTWAFYTIVKAWIHNNDIPWKHVVISGWILDPDRKKMSKSVGNVVTPHHLLEDYSSDGVRYWAARARLGADTAFDEGVLKVGKKLTTKLFNASRFVLSQLERVDADLDALTVDLITEQVDLDFFNRLKQTAIDAGKAFEKFDYAAALEVSEKEFWGFCNNYLELVKKRSYSDDDSAERKSALATLAQSLKLFLRLFAPFLPFITEEIWSWRFSKSEDKEGSVHRAAWPTAEEYAALGEPEVSGCYEAGVEVLIQIRSAKTEGKVNLRWPIKTLKITGSADSLKAVKNALDDVIGAGSVNEDGVELVEGAPPEGEKFGVEAELGEEEAAD